MIDLIYSQTVEPHPDTLNQKLWEFLAIGVRMLMSALSENNSIA